MEEIITVDGMQYRLISNSPLTVQQRSQTISDIRRQSGCGCGKQTASIMPQKSVRMNINAQPPPNITIENIKVGGIDCISDTCPDTTCTGVGCTTDTRDVVATYMNSENIPVDIVPNLTVGKTITDISDTIKNGANRLVQTQNNDGTWEWSNPDIDPITTQYPGVNNTLGVTARGLVKAYMVTGNIVYLNAAKKVSKDPDGFGPDDPGTTGKHKVYGQDITFLVEFADAWTRAGNDASTYRLKANDYMTIVLDNPNRLCASGCSGHADQLVAFNYDTRQPNLYGWDIRGWVEAAVKTGNMDFAKEIVSSMLPHEAALDKTATGTYSTGFSYVLGLAGYLDSYIMTGKTPDVYSTVKTKLLSELNENGSFNIYAGTDDGINQTAAYALMALNLAGTDMTNTINYLISSQSPGGQWIENDASEYTEVDSEIIVALANTVVPYIGTLTTLPAWPSIDVTFSDVVLSIGPNHICADWAPSIQIT